MGISEKDVLEQALIRQAREAFNDSLAHFIEGDPKEIDIFDTASFDFIEPEEIIIEAAAIGGCMVAIYPTQIVMSADDHMEIPWTDDDGEPLHLTLCYLSPEPIDGYQAESVSRAIESVVDKWEHGLSGVISGAGVLGENAKTVLVSMLGLSEMRADLVRQFAVEQVLYTPTYDFCPHMTVTYQPMDIESLNETYRNVRLGFNQICLVNGSNVTKFSFLDLPGSSYENPLVEGNRRGNPDRLARTQTFDPFVHPRNRVGKFRDVNNKIRDLQEGSSIDIFRFVKRIALPGVQTGVMTKTPTGYQINLQHGKETITKTFDGPMTKDDLAILLEQVQQNLDFTSLTRDEKLSLGLPAGRRPGQTVSEDGVRNSRQGTPAVDAVVVAQNGGLTPTGTDNPDNVAGSVDGEHWVMATWEPNEYDIYKLNPEDMKFLETHVAAIAHRTEAGGVPTIEYYSTVQEAQSSLGVKQNQTGVPTETEQNVDKTNVSPESPLATDPTSAGTDVASGVADNPVKPDVPPKVEPQLQTATPTLDKLMPQITGNNGDPGSGEHPENELYQALRNFAVSNTAATSKLPNGDQIKLVNFDFENEVGFGTKFSTEDILNTKFDNPKSLQDMQNAKGAIIWPNGLVSIFHSDSEMNGMWEKVQAAVPADTNLKEADSLGVYNRKVSVQKAIYRNRLTSSDV